MKRHGLWQFHRVMRQTNARRAELKLTLYKWWLPNANGEWISSFAWNECFQEARWAGVGTKAHALVRCAYRYFRRAGIAVPRAKQWNDLIEFIAARCGYTHYKTLEAAQVAFAPRPKSPVFCSEWSRPYLRIESPEVRARAARLQAARAARIRSEQFACWAQVLEAKSDLYQIGSAINSAKRALKERKSA